MFQLVIVLYSFMVLASTKECKPGLDCESRCCTILGGDVLCRERCLGISCELDVHCDGDCCVNSTCSSCLLKWTGTQNPKTTDQGKKYEPTQTKMVGSYNKTRSIQPTKISTSLMKKIPQNPKTIGPEEPQKTVGEETNLVCNSSSSCSSGCCIHGRCVDFSYCAPVAARRCSMCGNSKGGSITSLRDVILIIVGILLAGILFLVVVFCCACRGS